MKAIDIIQVFEKWALKELVDSWDNTGFQLGNPEKEVKKILVALDLDKDVLNKAIEEDYQMLITHHPIIFKPLKSITTSEHNTSIIYEAIKNDIVVYNAHSNLDLAEGGVNDALAAVLGIKDTKPLTESISNYGYGRIGYIDKMDFFEFLGLIKENLSLDKLIVYGCQKKEVEKIALCGGSGSDFIYDAYKHGAEVYITGDIKYHDAQYGHELGLTIIDAGHFHTEKVVLPIIKSYLEREIAGVEIEVLMESSLPHFIY